MAHLHAGGGRMAAHRSMLGVQADAIDITAGSSAATVKLMTLHVLAVPYNEQQCQQCCPSQTPHSPA